MSSLTSELFGFSLVYRRKRVLTSFGAQGNILRGLCAIPAHGASSLKQPSLGKQISFPVITQKCFKDVSLIRMLFLMVSLPKYELNYILWHIYLLHIPRHIPIQALTKQLQHPRLLVFISTMYDHLTPLVSLSSPCWDSVQLLNADVFLGPLVPKKRAALYFQALVERGEVFNSSQPSSRVGFWVENLSFMQVPEHYIYNNISILAPYV